VGRFRCPRSDEPPGAVDCSRSRHARISVRRQWADDGARVRSLPSTSSPAGRLVNQTSSPFQETQSMGADRLTCIFSVAVAQLGEHPLAMRKVAGSTPAGDLPARSKGSPWRAERVHGLEDKGALPWSGYNWHKHGAGSVSQLGRPSSGPRWPRDDGERRLTGRSTACYRRSPSLASVPASVRFTVTASSVLSVSATALVLVLALADQLGASCVVPSGNYRCRARFFFLKKWKTPRYQVMIPRG
jgi:hypothetical protein